MAGHLVKYGPTWFVSVKAVAEKKYGIHAQLSSSNASSASLLNLQMHLGLTTSPLWKRPCMAFAISSVVPDSGVPPEMGPLPSLLHSFLISLCGPGKRSIPTESLSGTHADSDLPCRTVVPTVLFCMRERYPLNLD